MEPVSDAAAITEIATFPPTSTLDNWSLTGTALFFATSTATPTATLPPDWCWFLTPSPTLLPTIYVTLDTAQLQATSAAQQTGTPTQTLPPTDAPPRAWCDSYIPGQDASAMTATQRAWPTPGQLPPVLAPATWTPVPARVRQQPQQSAPPTLPPQPSETPQIIYVTVPASNPPPQIIIIPATSQIIIVTATQSPTQEESATHAPTSTDLPTEVVTATPMDTETSTATPTETATPTLTDTPVGRPTDTETLMPTEQVTPEISS